MKRETYIENRRKKTYKSCVLCGFPIKDKRDFMQIRLVTSILEKLNGRCYGSDSLNVTLHKSCFETLSIPTQRRLTATDFTHKILNIENEIWVLLDEYGSPIWSTMWSDIPEINEKIQRLKKKGKMSPREKEWLKEMIN